MDYLPDSLVSTQNEKFVLGDDSIVISSDQDLAENWPGNGTKNEPYFIHQQNIFTDGIAILIMNTRAHLVISECNLSTTGSYGIYLYNASNIVIENNTFFEVVSTCIFSSTIWNCTFSENWVCYSGLNGFDIVFAENCVISNNKIHHNSQYGIVLHTSNYVNIIGNSFLDNRIAVNIPYSTYCEINGNNVTGHWMSGMHIYDCHNCSISKNNVSSNNGDGISIVKGSSVNISSNDSHNNAISGISVDECQNFTILDNLLYNNSARGLEFDISDNGTLVKNQIFNNSYGIRGSSSSNLKIDENHLAYNRLYGIYLTSCTNSTIASNRIVHNDLKGIYIGTGCTLQSIYYNEIGWNNDGNAQDNGNSNQWDDGIGLGNWWSDYTGTPTYRIVGDADSVDRWPRLLRTSSIGFDARPDDFGYEYGTVGNEIEWVPYSDNPSSYRMFSNQSLIDEGPWDGSSISENVDFLGVGIWNVVLYIFDIDNTSCSDSVIVTVTPDITNPTINHVEDMIIDYDELPINFTWNPNDSNPANYSIYLDDSLVQQDWWLGLAISFLLEPPIDTGVHSIMIIVFDSFGNSVTDTVLIDIQSSEVTTTTTSITTTTITTTTTTTSTTTTSTTSTTQTSTSTMTDTHTNVGPSGIDPTLSVIIGVFAFIVIVIIAIAMKKKN